MQSTNKGVDTTTSLCYNNNVKKEVIKMFYKIVLTILMFFAQPKHGYVIAQTYEGYNEYNDYYLVNIDGEIYEVEADDLDVNDNVTVYFIGNYTVQTLYGYR